MIKSFPLITTGYDRKDKKAHFIHVPYSYIHNQIALSDFKEMRELFKSGVTHARIKEK